VDAYGQPVESFSTLASVWAKIEYKSEVEKFENEQLRAVSSIDFTIRYRTDITEQMRISYDSNTYQITGIAEIGRGEGLKLKTKLYE
jgi:SPP1 family predicted phage head-tail adaptor